MKSYLMPAIIGASVIALATLLYAILLPSSDIETVPLVTNESTIIATPADVEQSSVSQSDTLIVKDEEQQTASVKPYKLIIDIARVQADGMAVFAGKGAPNGTIFITENGAIFAQNTIDEQGEWVVLPERPLAPGTHLLQLEMVSRDGVRERADVSLVVEIAQGGKQKPLVALVPQTDEAAPTLLQSPDEDSAKNEKEDKNTTDEPKTQAQQVAEILGQEDIFIQIGSLSWRNKSQLVIHGVASGGTRISGMIGTVALQDVALQASGRWSSIATSDPFVSKDEALVRVTLHDEAGKQLEQAQLRISKNQLSAGLDGSLMVVVHKGDALWRIAYRSYGQGVRYVDIVRRNADKIEDPDLIYPNQIFAVPGLKSE
ncbi:MAG: LysM peptidoglycan-binding domain-containing protein [Candidatus Puniceispirillaceae bacterium]